MSEKQPRLLTPEEMEKLIENVRTQLRAEEEERQRKGERRPEEPGLSGEARNFVVD